MHTWLAYGLMALLLQQPDTVEARIINYLRDNLQVSQGVDISALVNDVFTSAEEREALSRLYNTFFKVPIFLAQFQASGGQIPSLEDISEQFNLADIPGAADVMLRVMEADPRVPTFFERDPGSGEISTLEGSINIDVGGPRGHAGADDGPGNDGAAGGLMQALETLSNGGGEPAAEGPVDFGGGEWDGAFDDGGSWTDGPPEMPVVGNMWGDDTPPPRADENAGQKVTADGVDRQPV